MSGEAIPEQESSEADFVEQLEEVFDKLMQHTPWRVGMPSDTPLGWYEDKYVGKDEARGITLIVVLDEERTLYISKNFNGSSPEARLWHVSFCEQPAGTDASQNDASVTIDKSGKVSGTTPQLVTHMDSLLQEAADTMPHKQQEYLAQLDLGTLERAYLFQNLGLLQISASE